MGNKEIPETKENLELIFNISPDAVMITSLSDGRFVRVNDGFTFLSGFSRDEVIGKSSLEVNLWLNPVDRQKIVSTLNGVGYAVQIDEAGTVVIDDGATAGARLDHRPLRDGRGPAGRRPDHRLLGPRPRRAPGHLRLRQCRQEGAR